MGNIDRIFADDPYPETVDWVRREAYGDEELAGLIEAREKKIATLVQAYADHDDIAEALDPVIDQIVQRKQDLGIAPLDISGEDK